MRATLDLLGRETTDAGIGCRLITSKLADILFLQAMRSPARPACPAPRSGPSLLRDTPLTLQEIAVRVGYDSGAALSRVFTRREGASPGAWRRSR